MKRPLVKTKSSSRSGFSSAETGAALITAVLALLLATVLGAALLSAGFGAFEISENSLQQTEAHYISEAGLAHAIKLIQSAGSSEFTNILQAGDGNGGTGDELSTQPAANTPIPLAGLTLGNGTYTVVVSDDPAETDGDPNTDTNGRLQITSTGVGRDGSTVTIEAIVSISASPGIPALLVNGKLNISGNPEIGGSSGIVHANDTLDFDGNPCADQYFSSSSNIVDAGNAMGPGCGGVGTTLPNTPTISPPLYDIRTDFYNEADYILGAIGAQAGRVYDSVGNEIHDATSSDWEVGNSKWSWDPGSMRWVHGGDELPNGTYYSEGNMNIGDNFGTSGSPAQVTLVAEGYIEISGNPYMQADYDDFAVVAGTDLKVNGNPGFGENNYQGILYAYHQIDFSGNPAINGAVIAANQADTNSPGCGCNFIPRESGDFIKISGNPTINYDGSLFASGSSGVSMISWREVRF